MSKWLFYYPDLDSTQTGLTGGARSVKNLILGVKKRGIEPVFVSPSKGCLSEELREHGIEEHVIPLPNVIDLQDERVLEYSLIKKVRAVYSVLQYNQKIKAKARECRAHGIWVRGLRSVLLAGPASRMLRLPLIWDIGIEKPSRGLMRFLYAIGLLLSERVVTQAAIQRELIFGRSLASWYSKSFRTFYPGIASDRAARLRASRTTPEARPPEIVNIGSIHPRKNQHMSIEAFEYVCQCHPDATLNFVGPVQDREYAESLRSYVRSHELDSNVRFLGWRDDVPELLGRSAMLILSSYREGIPHVTREAMYASTPIVATAVGGLSESVEDGETGFLVPPDSPKEMGYRVNYLLTHSEERDRMGKSGLKLAQQRFSREDWLSDYVDLLHDLSDGHAK